MASLLHVWNDSLVEVRYFGTDDQALKAYLNMTSHLVDNVTLIGISFEELSTNVSYTIHYPTNVIVPSHKHFGESGD